MASDSVLEHDAVGRVAVRLNISRLLVVGAGARAMHVGAVMEGSWGNESMFFADADAAYEVLEARTRARRRSFGQIIQWLRTAVPG